jgi:cytokinesis protein
MNGTSAKGGAFGFKVSSINKVCLTLNCLFRSYIEFASQLVDTKSINNTTLLHFLEKTVSKHFPEMEVFLDELAKPAEAYRGSHRCSIYR